MNRVKYWEIIYNSVEQICIEKMLKGLYEVKAWEELHVALWTWVSLDGTKDKWEWFERFDVPEVKHYCFACQQAKKSFYHCRLTTEDENCKPEYCYYCPLINWEAEECLNGLYYKWLSADLLEEREELAREIANLEWNIK